MTYEVPNAETAINQRDFAPMLHRVDVVCQHTLRGRGK